MSIERTFKHSQQKGNVLLVLIVLDHLAGPSGRIVPDTRLVADLANMEMRNVQLAIKQLKVAGELTPSSQGGYTLTPEKSRGEACRQPDGAIAVQGDQLIANGRRSIDRPKRSPDRPKRSIDRPLKESFNLDSFKDSREGETKKSPPAQSNAPADNRASHPAITAVREILHRFTGKPYYPNKALWDKLIAALGETPDASRLEECFTLWVSKDNKPTNIAWALEWYAPGVLESKKGSPANGSYRQNSQPPANSNRPSSDQVKRDLELKRQRDQRSARG